MPRCSGAISNVSRSKLIAVSHSATDARDTSRTLLRHQVHGRRSASKRVHHKNIKRLPLAAFDLALHHKPRVADDTLGLRLAVAQEGEIALREIDHGRILS